jgi:benzodiazapine receptor
MEVATTSSMQKKVRKFSWWQIALITTGVSLLGSISSLMSSKNEQKLYQKKLKQAPWAPPAWIFGPAWTFNNFFLLQGLKRILENEKLPGRKKLLLLQGIIWTIFFTFNYLYFKKKSTVLAAIWTQADAVAALASFLIAMKGDKKLSANYLPLVLWTWFASTLAHYQALKNDDEFLKIKAPL